MSAISLLLTSKIASMMEKTIDSKVLKGKRLRMCNNISNQKRTVARFKSSSSLAVQHLAKGTCATLILKIINMKNVKGIDAKIVMTGTRK